MRTATREPIAATCLARKLMTERRWVDVDDFATDCERETMEMNQNQRSDGECRWRIGQSRAMVRPVEATRYRDFASLKRSRKRYLAVRANVGAGTRVPEELRSGNVHNQLVDEMRGKPVYKRYGSRVYLTVAACP